MLLYETDRSLADLASLVGMDAAVRAYQLGRDAIGHIEELCAAVGDPCGFARRPSVYLASSRRAVATLAFEHRLRRSHGLDCEFLSEDALAERFGIRAPAALYSGRQAEIDCYRFSHRLIAAATRHGARVYDRTEVTGIRKTHGLVELTTPNGMIRARRAICAAGYEATESMGRNLADLNSTWACVTEPLEQRLPWQEPCLLWETARPYFYLRTTDDGRVLMGGEDSRFSRRHEQHRVLEKKTARLLKRFHTMLPHVKTESAYSWAGVFSETRDGLPFVGQQNPGEGIHYALGYGGNGITLGVVAARYCPTSSLAAQPGCLAVRLRARQPLRAYGYATCSEGLRG